jgi:hypothetical protein
MIKKPKKVSIIRMNSSMKWPFKVNLPQVHHAYNYVITNQLSKVIITKPNINSFSRIIVVLQTTFLHLIPMYLVIQMININMSIII